VVEAIVSNNFMASPFQRYTGGIEASTGNLVQASGQMAQLTANAIAGFGQNIAEGLKQYNENSQKSEAANAKIQMLGQAYADKIAMYSKDPEIAQSGILDGLMAKAKMLQDAPTKGLSQRVMIAHEAETSLAGFGGQLQEWSFLRGREMERNADEALRKFDGVVSVTNPAFTQSGEFQFDPNKTLEENKAGALAKLNAIRKSNPKMQGSDQEFLSNWLNNAEQTMAKADPAAVPPAVTSAILEQIQADKRLNKSNANAAKTGLVEDFLSKGKMSSRADFEKTQTSAADILLPKVEKKEPTAMDTQLAQTAATANENVKRLEAKKAELEAQLKEEEKRSYFKQSSPVERTIEKTGNLIVDAYNNWKQENSFVDPKTGEVSVDGNKVFRNMLYKAYPAATFTPNILEQIGAFDTKSQYEKDVIKSTIAGETVTGEGASAKRKLEAIEKQLQAQKSIAGGVAKAVEPEKPKQTVAPIALGEQVVGSQEEVRRRSVQERQREVSDFITSRMGAIDPTDPERKRRLPVAGFDKFYKSLVPEAEIREFTTDSGVRMMYANGKWEQIKGADPMTIQDIRKQSIGVYGQQNAQGGLSPTEFVEGSGVYIGGIFKGTDSANDKYSDEMTQLIDARRSVKELQRINDLVGESLMPVEQGRALVEQMNLSAMLRTDIVGVGTVSNYEQQLIAKVIKDPTAFFSFESKDRAILVALAQRVDRRIKAISASKGLTVKIRDDSGSNKYQALREQYLKEKGLL
jgi:hypothetical protein